MSLPHNASSDEWNLILACARTRLDDVQRERIRTLVKKPLHWTRVCEMAREHSVDALVQRNLSRAAQADVPPEALAYKEKEKKRAQWNLLLAGQMIEVLERCEKDGLAIVPYKGPTLALLAYGDLGLRHAVDLDFVLRQRDVARAFDVLSAAGYRGELDPARAGDARLIADGNRVGQYCFRKAGCGLVELHTENTLRYFPVPLDWEGLRGRLRPVSFAGRRIETFSVEDLLVLLPVHGAKHFWNRLSWVCDIAELAQFGSGVDWAFSEDLAARMGCRRMWLLGLSLANAVLDAPLSDFVLERIRADDTVGELTRSVAASLSAGSQGEPAAPQRLLFRMRSSDSLGRGLRQCLRLVTQPTERDWLAPSLPGWASPLHMLLRPVRLLRKYGLGGRAEARHKR